MSDNDPFLLTLEIYPNELHKLLRTEPNVEEVQALIHKYPNAVREKNNIEYLPLHVALYFGASLEVIQLLIKEYSDAVKVKGNGYLPLHVALYHALNSVVSDEVLQLLIKETPDAMKEKDRDGRLPLHFALEFGATVKFGASVEVIKLLIKEDSDAVKKKDQDGLLPLHVAINSGASKEVLQLLIKEYPDAVKVKDNLGRLPLSAPQIKEIYDRLVTVVQNLTRSKGLRGDNPKGKDLLGVEEEIQAIAETIAMKDLQPPFVVGILGGWGSGKSFTFNLIWEYLKGIQKYDLASEAVKLNSPYVGHIYPIEFSAWTFAKDDLWASIMHRILTELNDQLSLEEVIGPELLKEGVSVIALMDEFTTIGDRKYLKEAVKDGRVQQQIREWKRKDGNITKAFIDAINSNYEKEVKELEEKKEKLLKVTVKKKHHLAWEEVTSDFNSTFLPEIKKLLKNAYDQYAKRNPLDPVPQTVDAAMNSMEQYKGMFGRFKIYWGLLRAGNISPLWLTVFLSSLVIAVVLPLVIHNTGLIATAIGPLVSGIYTVYNNAREKLSSAQVEIAKVASKMRLDKEQVRKALEAADRAQAQLRSDTNDEERQQDIMRGLNAEINALEDRVWLREGDSLKKVVVDRLGSSNYEERLGVVHQAQADLQHISDAMLRRDGNEEDAAKKIFPRGDPRIVLFIDDLDRCPPEKVVETLEAVQLLVNTDLFVVVLAIDAKYVTLCLEKNYVDILHPERHPSGLDYIEKIIQLPYRVPPISAEYMKSYLQEQMNAKKMLTHKSSDSEELSDEFNRARPNVDISAPLLSENASDEATSCAETPMMETAQSKPQEPSLGAEESKRDDDIQSPSDNAYPSDRETPMTETAQFEPDAVPLPTEELDFTWEELELVEDVCVFSGVIPRSAKRLVNVFKLMKIIWHRREQTPDEDTPHEVSMKDACVLILALCASNSRSVRREICKVLVKIETATSRPADCGNLKSFIKNTLGEIESEQVDDSPLTMIYDEKCNGIF